MTAAIRDLVRTGDITRAGIRCDKRRMCRRRQLTRVLIALPVARPVPASPTAVGFVDKRSDTG
jgi:hypothetical protein